jgi:competence protein ComEA
MDRRCASALLLAFLAWTSAADKAIERRGHAGEETPAWVAARSFAGAVEVRGAVAHPGVWAGLAGRRAGEAITLAGAKAKPRGGDARAILMEGDVVEAASDGTVRIGRMFGERLLSLELPIDIATADATDLEALPGVGPVTAAHLVAWRHERGGIRALDELGAAPGVGPRRLARIRPFLCVTKR